MTRLDNPDSRIDMIPDGEDPMKEQLRQRQQALEMPTRKDVINQACKLWGKNGVYEGSWLSGGKNNLNCPGAGKGTFTSESLEINGEWDANGKLTKIESGKLKANGRDYDIVGADFDAADPTKIVSIKCKSSADNLPYNCELDANFKLAKIEYEGVTLNLTTGGSLVNSSKSAWLALGGSGSSSVPVDLAAVRIAKCVSIVKKAIQNKERDGLDAFEAENTWDYDTLQADYLNYGWDTDLLTGCKNKTGVTANELANWLNKSRTDFGI